MPVSKLTRFIGLSEEQIDKVYGQARSAHLGVVGHKLRGSCEICPPCTKPNK